MITKQQFLTTFFNRLNQNNIDYFVYGEYENLPDGNGDSDIDMMLPLEQFPRLFGVLLPILRRENIPVVSYYRNKVTSFVRILTPEWGIQFDFFGGIYHKGSSYYDMEYIKGNVIKHKGFINVLSIETGYYLDFLKETIHICKAKDKYINGFIKEYINNPVRKNELCEKYGHVFIDKVESNISFDALKRVVKELNQIMMSRVHSHDFINRLGMRLYNFKRCFRSPGYVIVVEGTDGSGKSFIINTISPILNEAFHRGVVYNHLRPNVIPDIAVLMGKRKKAEKEEVIVVSDPHAGKQSGFAGSLVRWGYYMIDYTLGYLKKVWPAIHTKSKVFIFDRYYYEYYFDQKRSHTSLPQWILRVGEWFLPRPDLILCLGGDPKKIYERKPETSLEEVTRQTRVLKEFCTKRNNAIWVDTTIAPEDSVRCAMEAICKMMSKRFANVNLK